MAQAAAPRAPPHHAHRGPPLIGSPAPVSPSSARAWANRKDMSPPESPNLHGSDTGETTKLRNVERKSSFSDLLTRLTAPTAASRSKMRDASRLASSPADLRSPRQNSTRKSPNASELPISRPFLPQKPSSTLRSNSGGICSPPVRRKAPSPPTDGAVTAKNSTAGSQSPPSAYSTPILSSDHISNLNVPHGPSDARTNGSANERLLQDMHSAGGPNISISENLSNSSIGTAESADSAKGVFKKLPDAPLHTHRRRLSAPAPVLNLTTPRAMSKAGLPSSAGAAVGGSRTPMLGSSSGGAFQTPKSEPSIPNSRTTKTLPKLNNQSLPDLPVNASHSHHSKPTPPKLDTSLKGLKITSKPPAAETTPKLPAVSSMNHFPRGNSPNQMKSETQEDLWKELARLKAHSDSLRTRNKQLKTRLDEALVNHDQTNIELSVTAASRNALRQQVVGYEKLYESTVKNLEHSQKLVKVLKFNVQELKMALQEKELEIYNLMSRQKQKTQSIHSADLSPLLISPASL